MEAQKAKLHWDSMSLQPECPLWRKQITTNVGEGVGEKEVSHTVGGNINWDNHHGACYGGSLKNLKYDFLILLVIHPRESKSVSYSDTDVPCLLCSYSRQPKDGVSPDAPQRKSGWSKCGTYPQCSLPSH
jgi:hypothetical protein